MSTQVNKKNATKRSYKLRSGGELSFDPQKDLNLPSSYEEVLDRFEKIQGARKGGSN